MSSKNGNKKGAKRLTEQDRLEIITKLSRPNPPSKRYLAREYNVDEKAVRQIWSKKDEIEDYDRIVSCFSVFQGHLRHLTNKVKEQRVARMRQSTLHDAWNKT